MTHPRILGIDPGNRGALVWITAGTQLIRAEGLPVKRVPRNGRMATEIDNERLRELLTTEPFDEVWLEAVFASPQMGVTSSFSFGRGRGALEGQIAALGVPCETVAPSVWKRALACTADKNQTKARARELFAPWAKMLTSEGKCEASLIALYGALKRAGRI